MIAKIPKPGKSFGGCIQYNVLKKGATILEADGIRIDKVGHIIADFNMQRKMNPGLGQAVGHIALSWSPNDQELLNDEKMIGIAHEYLDKMKIINTQVLMVRHKDKDHPHLHIVYNRVNNEGKTISDNFQRQKSIKISHELTLKHGMYLGQGKGMVKRRQLKGIDKVKYELFDAIKAVSQKVNNMDELKKQLAKQGIGMIYKYQGNTKIIQGISFSKGTYKFKGSEIDRSLSFAKLSQSIQQRVSERQTTEQLPSLAQQLRQVMQQNREKQGEACLKKERQTNEPQKENTPLTLLDSLFVPVPVEDPEPRKKKKKQEHEREQSRGMHL